MAKQWNAAVYVLGEEMPAHESGPWENFRDARADALSVIARVNGDHVELAMECDSFSEYAIVDAEKNHVGNIVIEWAE